MNKAQSWDPHPDLLSPLGQQPGPWGTQPREAEDHHLLPGGREDHLGSLTTAGAWPQSKKPKNTEPHSPHHKTETVVPSWPQTRVFPSLLQTSGQSPGNGLGGGAKRPLTQPEDS